ncbi:MAG: CPBP family intramembrane metalloprotease [Cyanobacteria bacterium SZAS-4]|nr:CPBP family intramembrane metalloprotease [Cyanobacteria bacterium SZAS-4]
MKTRHYLWCLAFVGIIGFSFYLLKSSQVFPSASIEIKLSKTQITQKSEEWASKLGYHEDKPIRSTTFAYDDDGKTFLEYELGSTQANALMKQTIPIWYWTTRFCKPLKQEEFSCWISPDGRLAAFDRALENDRELPSVKHDQALTMAQNFLTHDANLSLDGYKLIEQASIEQPHRTDHNFTWEDTKQEWHGAKLRTHIYISGNSVTSFNHYLHVPDVWTRKFSKLRSYNDALADAASIFYVALNTGSFFVFIWAFANSLIRWRFALVIAGAYAVLAALESINGLPSQWHGYDTSMPEAGFQLSLGMGVLTSALQTFVQTFILTASAEALYRRFFPEKLALEKIFTTAGLRAQSTVNGLISGTAAFGTHLGWIVLFYLAGRPLGLWCPLEVQNEESLSSYVPFFSALHVGFTASLTEEFTYRVIGLIAFQRLVKNFWLANLLQAAAWAFMHSNYPQEPPYARGVELTVVGFFYGSILRYFGVFPCIFSHNLIDTFLGLEPLFASSVPTLRISAFFALIPFIGLAIAALLLRLTKGESVETESITNKALFPVSPPPAVLAAEELAPRSYQYKPLKRITRLTLAILATAFTAIEFFYYVPAVGQSALLTVPRETAIAQAKQYLEAHDVHLEGYSDSASLVKGLDDDEMQYVFEKAPKRLYELSEIPERPLIWRVRFFKHLVQTEYLVLLDSRGKMLSMGLTQPDDEPGASLTEDEAKLKVQAFLDKEHKEITPYKLASVPREEKKQARTDYTVQFDVPKYKVGEAEYKLTSECLGDKVSGYDHNWILPDQWKFDRSKKYLREEVCRVLVWIVWLIFAVALVLWGKGVLRSHAIPWKPAIIIGLITGVFNIVETVNGLPDLFTDYGTEKPLVSFFVGEAVRTFAAATSSIAMYAALAAFGLGALRLLMPSTSVASVLRTTFLPADAAEKATSANIWIDATIIGFVVGLGQRVIWIALGWMRSQISPTISMAPLDALCGLVNIYNPSVSTVLDAVVRGVTLVFGVAIVIGIYLKYLRTTRNYFIFAIAISFIFPSQDRYWQDYVVDVLNYLLTFGIAYFLISKLARENLLAYFLAGFVSTIVGSMRVLMKHAAGLYFDDLVFLTALMMSPVVYVIYKRINRPKFLGGSKPTTTTIPDPMT